MGLTGWTYPFVDQTMPPFFSEGLIFTLDVEEMKAVIQRLRVGHKADLVVVISHMGLPLDVKAASLIDGIDIILSGHRHDRIAKPIRQNGTWIIQSGASASFLCQLDLTFEYGKITNVRHRLIPLLSDQFEEDPDLSLLIKKIMQPYETQLNEVIGELKTPLHRMTLNETPMDCLITDAYLHAAEADIALSHGWRYGAPGRMTVKDLYQIIPTNPELFTVELDGQSILKAFEANLEQVFSPDPFQQKGGYVLRSSGITMAYKPYNPKGNRIEHFLVRGNSAKKKLELHAHKAIKHFFADHKIVEIGESPHIFCI